MIPVVTIVAFTLMGIEGIADEIEQPFGTDKSDLPLGTTYAVIVVTGLLLTFYIADTYCNDLKEEVE